MDKDDLVSKAYEISDRYNVILKGNIKLSRTVYCLLIIVRVPYFIKTSLECLKMF